MEILYNVALFVGSRCVHKNSYERGYGDKIDVQSLRGLSGYQFLTLAQLPRLQCRVGKMKVKSFQASLRARLDGPVECFQV